jgi:hypothetical protein
VPSGAVPQKSVAVISAAMHDTFGRWQQNSMISSPRTAKQFTLVRFVVFPLISISFLVVERLIGKSFEHGRATGWCDVATDCLFKPISEDFLSNKRGIGILTHAG